MKTQKNKTTRASTQTPATKANPENRTLPPDQGGEFKRAAARGKKVIALYEKLDTGADEFLLSHLLHDLLHLCDRDRTLGGFHEQHGFALRTYQDSVAENMWALRWYDDFEAAREAAQEMMFSDAK